MSDLEKLLDRPVILVNTLEPDFAPVIVPYGSKNRIKFRSDTRVMERYTTGNLTTEDLCKHLKCEARKKGILTEDNPDHLATQDCLRVLREWEQDYEDWRNLRERISEDFGNRGDEIVASLREAVINYEEHRNCFDLTKEIYIWPWRSVAHLCFAINSTGKPNYNFNPTQVRLTPIDPDTGELHMGDRGRGHIMMSAWANFLAYDEHGGMFLYFNLPKEHWLNEETSESLKGQGA